GWEVLQDKIQVVLTEEARLNEKNKFEQKQRDDEQRSLLEATQEIEELRQIITDDIEVRHNKQRIVSAWLRNFGIATAITGLITVVFYLTDPKFLGGFVSRREMMIGIFSSLTASLISSIGSRLSRPTNRGSAHDRPNLPPPRRRRAGGPAGGPADRP
ncbi:MAG TPA: hypothetical protein VHU81_06700, partial [Thermoanaerobaculia bacterium]|nr:hypothetical protein [Thermoanaerobaculia bacterium]